MSRSQSLWKFRGDSDSDSGISNEPYTIIIAQSGHSVKGTGGDYYLPAFAICAFLLLIIRAPGSIARLTIVSAVLPGGLTFQYHCHSSEQNQLDIHRLAPE